MKRLNYWVISKERRLKIRKEITQKLTLQWDLIHSKWGRRGMARWEPVSLKWVWPKLEDVSKETNRREPFTKCSAKPVPGAHISQDIFAHRQMIKPFKSFPKCTKCPLYGLYDVPFTVKVKAYQNLPRHQVPLV